MKDIWRKMLDRLNRKNRIIKSNYGRNGDWIIELNSYKIAKMSNPVALEQFIYQYDLKLVNNDYKMKVIDEAFWENNNLKFFSVEINEYSSFKPLVKKNK